MSFPSIRSFSDELQKLAFSVPTIAGGLMGAGIGSFLPGNKLRNGLIGGAIGATAGGVLNTGKRLVYDTNHHRSQQLAAQAPPGDPNYVPTWQQGYR